MSQTYSTRTSGPVGGRGSANTYSTAARPRAITVRATPIAPPSPVPAEPTAVAPEEAPALPPVLPPVRFTLQTAGLPAASRIAPGASGSVDVTIRPDGSAAVQGTIQGLKAPSDPALKPVLWLIHDLAVPRDLSPADLVQLARGNSGIGNRPGSIFTVDGNSPTYGTNPNTLSIAVTPGPFTPAADGTWQLQGVLDAASNQCFHPLVVLGPRALADINAAVPSGLVARILTDLFMRPATIHPELNLKNQFQQRLAAVVQDHLNAAQPDFLTPERFTRVAVTLEGLVRGIPRLMPTRDTCFLLSPEGAR